MENNTKKTSFAACFALASAWFGTHCGSGFATGAQATSFWVKYGAHAIYLPILSAIIMAVVAGITWELSRVRKAANYRQFGDALFEPYDKIFGTIYEILFIAIMVMGVSAVFAGAGALLESWLSIPFIIGVILVIAATVLFTMFGTRVILSSASILSTILIVVITICTIIGMSSPQARLGEVVSNWETEYSALPAIWSAILYASFQCVIVGATVNLTGGLQSSKDSKVGAIFGFLMNCGMMVLLTYMLLAFYPQTTGETLPVLAVLNTMNRPWLASAYSFMLLLAFLTTAISCIGSLVSRLEPVGKKAIQNDNARRFVISLVIILICFGIAQFGLLNIIKKGYNAVGYLGIPFVILPTLFIAPRKIRQAKAAMKAAEQS